MYLQGAASEPGADALERRPLDNGEAKQLLKKASDRGRLVTMTLTWWSAS